MCFVIPLQITATHGTTATLENALTADIGALESCSVGDYVIVTSGIAVLKVDALDAKAMRSQIKETYDELS
ncbi:MAG: HypC/HybG/HupF family hydrogenase formation chaperone [Patescibacteria group bacterium]